MQTSAMKVCFQIAECSLSCGKDKKNNSNIQETLEKIDFAVPLFLPFPYLLFSRT